MIIRLFTILICICSLSACKENDALTHNDVIIRGYKFLPVASNIRKKFGAWSFITHWNIPNNPKYGFKENEKEWQTLSYLYGRYEIIYIQRVILKKNGGDIDKSTGQASLLIREFSRIYGDSYAPSSRFTDFQITIEGQKLDKLVESNWNFSSIGIKLKEKSPIKNIGWMFNYWNRIYSLQKVTP